MFLSTSYFQVVVPCAFNLILALEQIMLLVVCRFKPLCTFLEFAVKDFYKFKLVNTANSSSGDHVLYPHSYLTAEICLMLHDS